MEVEPISNAFEGVLRNQRKGKFASELSEQLQELTKKVVALGRGGSITIKLKLTPATTDGAALMVSDQIEVKAPEPAKTNSIFYTTNDGQLVRENPAQQEMPLNIVQAPNQQTDKAVNE